MFAQQAGLFKLSSIAGVEGLAGAGKESVDLTAGEMLADIAPTISDGVIAAVRRA
ncbi:MAG: hypothetical protein KK482_24865 [Sinorhizobium meliloti]|nr:hypothetical protein [Sinorhizobium meliloti]